MTSKAATCSVVLAAGAGTRMRSSRSKVLFPAAGRPLLAYPLLAAAAAGVEQNIVVVSPSNCEEIDEALTGIEIAVTTAVQETARGTGDAAAAALPHVHCERVLILCGDAPLVDAEELARLTEAFDAPGVELALLSCRLPDPSGYGRVLRDGEGMVQGIGEHKDLVGSPALEIDEVNAGVYLVSTALLREALAGLSTDNAQGEFYLTDIVAVAAARGQVAVAEGRPEALLGVNDRRQLARVEALLFERIAERHRAAGVSVQAGAWIDDTVVLEADAEVRAGAALRGATRVANGATVDVGCVLTDATIGAGATLKPYSVVQGSSVGEEAQIGPFAHIRPGCTIESEVRFGNFVEAKNTRLRRGAKVGHLSYLGDGDVGERSNLGAGTIFCNYDGVAKHRTVIGKDSFIGSDSQLVAPVSIGEGALVGSGTTVTRDVPAGALALSRSRQVNKEGYASPLRQRLRARAEEKD